MKAHSQGFKEKLVQFGRDFNDLVTYNGTTLSNEDLISFNISYKSSLMKTVMKELKVDTKLSLQKGGIINYQLGLKVGNSYEYLPYGNFIVDKIEEQKDKRSNLVTCYDKMLLTMIDYEALKEYELTEDTEFVEEKDYFELVNNEYVEYTGERTGNPHTLGLYEEVNIYPITIRDYVNKICSHLGITFANANSTFINYNKQILNELYLDDKGKSLGYTFRDVLDELAQVTGSFICINNDDELEIRYITQAVGTKNMYEYKSRAMSNQVTTTYDITDGALILNGTANNTWVDLTSDTPLVLNTGTYTFSTKTKKPYIIRLRVTYSDNTTGNFNIAKNTLSKTFTTSKQIIKQRVFIYEDNTLSGTQFDNEKIYLQLEKGNQATAYEPYYDTINEEYFNDVNVSIGKKYGPINSLVFSRSADSDSIAETDQQSIEQNGLCEIKISDNQILNGNNRDEFRTDLFNYLNGKTYYLNDYDSRGILYYEVGDMYNVSINGNIYNCLMLCDEINRSPGVKETIYTEEPDTSETEYKAVSKTDKTINKAYLIVNKQEGTIEGLVSKTNEIDVTVNNNYQELKGQFNDYVPTSQYVTLETAVTTLQTDTYTRQQIDTKLIDGSVQKVMTASGTFDINGMHYEKTNAPTSTTINEVGVGVNKTSDTDYVLFAGYVDANNTQFSDYQGQTIVASENMLVKNYFVIGDNSRMENYENGTGCFYIGG